VLASDAPAAPPAPELLLEPHPHTASRVAARETVKCDQSG